VLMANALSLALSSNCTWASLASSTVSSLIKSSDSILRGTIVRTELTSEYHGVATVKLNEVYVGWSPSATFTIEWDHEPEAQPLDQVGREYVFFLRRTSSDTLAAAQIGRSYWPLVHAAPDGPLVTPYVGLLDILVIDIPSLLGKERVFVPGLPYPQNRVEMKVLYLHELIPALHSIWLSRAKHGLYNYRMHPTSCAPLSLAWLLEPALRARRG
jgi:hypothetical protein